MKVSALLDIDRRNACELGVPEALGDGFLVGRNRVYRLVRAKAVELGYRFGGADSELARSYFAAPLFSLPAILAERLIPCAPTATALRALPRDTEADPALLTGSLQRNLMMHEASHAIANHALGIRFEEASGSRGYVLRLMMAESFANAAELLASCLASEGAVHGLFFRLNSQVPPRESRSAEFAAELAQGDTRGLVRRLIRAFLRSNFLEAEKDEGPLYREAFELALGFRKSTTAAFFGSIGISGSLELLLGFDCVAALEADPKLLAAEEELVGLLAAPLNSDT